jgi:hypothetical protein
MVRKNKNTSVKVSSSNHGHKIWTIIGGIASLIAIVSTLCVGAYHIGYTQASIHYQDKINDYREQIISNERSCSNELHNLQKDYEEIASENIELKSELSTLMQKEYGKGKQ